MSEENKKEEINDLTKFIPMIKDMLPPDLPEEVKDGIVTGIGIMLSV